MQETIFHFVRDYETVKVEQEVPNEFLLVLYDGDDERSWHPDRKTKAMGAYYKNIERKMYLKKKRANVSIILQIRTVISLQCQQLYDHYEDKWEIIRALHAPMSIDEEDERQEALAEVVDPMYMFSRADADADGEVDETAGMLLSESVDVTSEV